MLYKIICSSSVEYENTPMSLKKKNDKEIK